MQCRVLTVSCVSCISTTLKLLSLNVFARSFRIHRNNCSHPSLRRWIVNDQVALQCQREVLCEPQSEKKLEKAGTFDFKKHPASKVGLEVDFPLLLYRNALLPDLLFDLFREVPQNLLLRYFWIHFFPGILVLWLTRAVATPCPT